MKEFEPEAEVARLADSFVEFSLRGVPFRAKPAIDHRDFDMFMSLGDASQMSGAVERLNSAIRNTLLPEYRDAWYDLLQRDLDVPITFDTLVQVANYLVEATTDRPTSPSSRSGRSGENGATSSQDGSSTRRAAASTLSPPSSD